MRWFATVALLLLGGIPITLETCGGVTSLETVPGSPGWYRYQGASAAWTRGGRHI